MKRPVDAFRKYDLSRIREAIQALKIEDELLGVSLYGSANYNSCGIEQVQLPKGGDYDCWIVFERGTYKQSIKLSNYLLSSINNRLQNAERPFITYGKIPSNHKGRFLSPMILTADCYNAAIRFHQQIKFGKIKRFFIHWYRTAKRQRSPVVPMCGLHNAKRLVSLNERFDSKTNLWLHEMPVCIKSQDDYFMGTFTECCLTGNIIYQKNSLLENLTKQLVRSVVDLLQIMDPCLNEIGSNEQKANRIYNLFTIRDIAPYAFRRRFIERCLEALNSAEPNH